MNALFMQILFNYVKTIIIFSSNKNNNFIVVDHANCMQFLVAFLSTDLWFFKLIKYLVLLTDVKYYATKNLLTSTFLQNNFFPSSIFSFSSAYYINDFTEKIVCIFMTYFDF